jgi:hypothetical protein
VGKIAIYGRAARVGERLTGVLGRVFSTLPIPKKAQ